MGQVTASRSGLPLPADAAFKLGCVAVGHNPLLQAAVCETEPIHTSVR